MRLRGVGFPPICNAAGAQGFFGEGYPYHWYWKLAGLTFAGCGFMAKTTTLERRAGNMPLKADGITPVERKPKCIYVDFLKGIVLNAVGLSNHGAEALLKTYCWQQRHEPFFLSFMAVGPTVSERLDELEEFVTLLARYKPGFQGQFGLEINFSCPNAGIDPTSLINEVGSALDIAGALGIPLQCKFNATVPVKALCEVARHPNCDAITMSNTIPWGQLPDRIDWKGLFGTDISPLAHLGGGGLSGWPLLPIVCDWIREARDCGFAKPIWACGGIDSVRAVRQAKQAGASGVQIGTVAIVRPWRMRGIIRYAHEIF